MALARAGPALERRARPRTEVPDWRSTGTGPGEIGGHLLGGLERMTVQERQHHQSHLRPDGGDALEQAQVLFQAGMAADVLVDLALSGFHLAREEVHGLGDGATTRAGISVASVPFPGGCARGAGPPQGRRAGPGGMSSAGGATDAAPPEVPDLGRIGNGHRDAGPVQGERRCFVVDARAFQDGVQGLFRDALLAGPRQQLVHPGRGICDRIGLPLPPRRVEQQAAVQLGLGNINIDAHEKHKACLGWEP